MPRIEIWRDIPGYKYYQASLFGRIRRKAGTPFCPKGHILDPRARKVTKTGVLPYIDITLSEDGILHFQTVHRLVALAFHGLPPSARHEVAHLDDDPSNNQPSNLKWATSLENKHLSYLHGRRIAGENHWRAKLKNKDAILLLKAIAAGVPVKDAADMFGVFTADIANLLAGRSYRYLSVDDAE